MKQKKDNNLKDVLIVIDMQNDFIDGSLGTKEAQDIVPNVASKIKEYEESGKKIIFTRDTHYSDYLNTYEGKLLPVEHCIQGTCGWCISDKIGWDTEYKTLNKQTFGKTDWCLHLPGNINSIEICGLCTDICVVSNALILRALYPEIDITVDASCCAGVTPEKHKAALEVMESCQINVIGG